MNGFYGDADRSHPRHESPMSATDSTSRNLKIIDIPPLECADLHTMPASNLPVAAAVFFVCTISDGHGVLVSMATQEGPLVCIADKSVSVGY